MTLIFFLASASAALITSLQQNLKTAVDNSGDIATAMSRMEATHKEAIQELRLAVFAVSQNQRGGGQSSSGNLGGTFYVKQKGVEPYSGERTAAAVYAWMTNVENCFSLRARETGTLGSTNS